MVYLYNHKFWLSIGELYVIQINHADFSEGGSTMLFRRQGVL